ncbi:hypothetical protein [Paenibacillus dokdonensis]|nr:hypothetical protein [Paenibacillus dokdonensis]
MGLKEAKEYVEALEQNVL